MTEFWIPLNVIKNPQFFSIILIITNSTFFTERSVSRLKQVSFHLFHFLFDFSVSLLTNLPEDKLTKIVDCLEVVS